MTTTGALGLVEEREPAAAIDWELAARVAVLTSGSTDYARTSNAVTMPGELRVLTARAQALVEDFTGLTSAAGPATAEVIDRPRWIRANIAGFRHLLEPMAEKITASEEARAQRPMPGWAKSMGSKILGLELGALLGFLSQRVLGQYDLLLPEEAAGSPPGGVVYYVGPNIAVLEARHGFQPSDFRLWIALHEVTHRTQFTAVPWLRSHFLGLVDESIGGMDPDPRRIVDGLAEIVARVRRGESAVGEEGLVGIFAGEEQRRTFERVQSLMTVLEGHGNYVMDALGAEHVAGQAYMSRVLSQRRQRGGFAQLVLRLLGMEMKARQYEEGQRFLTAVCEAHGPRALDGVWAGPENLPSLTEIRNAEGPDAWYRRVTAGLHG
ncbi:MAG: zinc-dependent metalloprotease [Acidimicrobiia bacterium]|nr:zinc-dependent metalloprotease [Acidimicrobiia bacterium]